MILLTWTYISVDFLSKNKIKSHFIVLLMISVCYRQ